MAAPMTASDPEIRAAFRRLCSSAGYVINPFMEGDIAIVAAALKERERLLTAVPATNEGER
jgi:hypothetical protein